MFFEGAFFGKNHVPDRGTAQKSGKPAAGLNILIAIKLKIE